MQSELTYEMLAPFSMFGLKGLVTIPANLIDPEETTVEEIDSINSECVTFKGHAPDYYFEDPDFGFMPILYGISSLNGIITINGKEFNPLEELTTYYNDILSNGSEIKRLEFHNLEEVFTVYGLQTDDSIEVAMPYLVYQKLLEWKINILNIPKHLYIDVNTLDSNPY